ncbi:MULTISPECIES: hypothetical protein [unclassified Novosphingobium]|uniref:hypothetical protein n=1 Tax=unclassified Novosphingobium TaxID=2644732 RepID=UPI0006C84CB8|nr:MULTISPECIES: hypothetical protein [unclassified Novosphingobium]KPH60635.1 hypothetical protein ADT71_19320 [Novosphingobium sp. ST904]MPS67851.1 hypothetical protein [Novosphingobium sp.]TCM39361.1 hypothetical protein EDF59_106246 [Novosphingobium sp. ST904]
MTKTLTSTLRQPSSIVILVIVLAAAALLGTLAFEKMTSDLPEALAAAPAQQAPMTGTSRLGEQDQATLMQIEIGAGNLATELGNGDTGTANANALAGLATLSAKAGALGAGTPGDVRKFLAAEIRRARDAVRRGDVADASSTLISLQARLAISRTL